MNRGMDRFRTGSDLHTISQLTWLRWLGACIAIVMCLPGCTGSSSAGKKVLKLSPNNGARNTTAHVLITGTTIVAGSTLTVSGNGITIANVHVTPSVDNSDGVEKGSIVADFVIAADADLDGHTVTIAWPGASATVTFTVLPLGSSTVSITKVEPRTVRREQTTQVTITGLGFQAGDVVAVSGTGITVTTDSVTSDVIHATFVVDATASQADRLVTVVRANGLVSNGVDFGVSVPSGIGSASGTIVFTSNLTTMPGGAVSAYPSVYTGLFNSFYSNLTQASVSLMPDSHPRFSPDRTAIVFVRSDNSTGGGSSIYLMDHDGQHVRKVTPVGDHGESFGKYSNWPSFHPDGRHILFTNGAEFSRIAIMDVDGSHARFIYPAANANINVTGPLYSPVGLKIVFSSTQDGPAHIFVVNDDGTNLQRLTNTSDGDRHPAYSYPLGGFITYERDHYDNAGNATRNLYTIGFDGSNNTAITTDGKSFDPGFFHNSDTVSSIVFVSNRSGNDEIYKMNNQGGDVVQMTTLNLSGAALNDPSTTP